MTPMQGETILLQVAGNKLILSTHRVRYQTEAVGSAELKSIMLEELASIVMTRSSHIILLILAGVSFVLGFFASTNTRYEPVIIGLFGAVIFVVLFFASRQQVISLASAGTTITVNTQGMNHQAVKEFVERTEAAKNSRYLMAKR